MKSFQTMLMSIVVAIPPLAGDASEPACRQAGGE